jgi:paraquat-inducible protein B
MSKKASPVAIGVFVLGAIAIVLIGTVFFGASTFFDRTEKFVLYFDGSLQGLKVGAPVSMKGVQVGTVKTISINVYENKQLDVFTEVVIEVNIDNFHQMGDHKVHTGAQQLVHDGLRAQLRLQSLLTGLLYVELDFFPRSAVDLKNLQASKLPE